MRLTIIKDDNAVYVDGVALTVDCSSLPAGFHALQWYDTGGEIEMANAEGRIVQNVPVSDLRPYQSFVDAWNAANKAKSNATAAKVAAAARPAAVNVIAN